MLCILLGLWWRILGGRGLYSLQAPPHRHVTWRRPSRDHHSTSCDIMLIADREAVLRQHSWYFPSLHNLLLLPYIMDSLTNYCHQCLYSKIEVIFRSGAPLYETLYVSLSTHIYFFLFITQLPQILNNRRFLLIGQLS